MKLSLHSHKNLLSLILFLQTLHRTLRRPGAVVKSSPLVPRGPGFDPASLHCTLAGVRLGSYNPSPDPTLCGSFYALGLSCPSRLAAADTLCFLFMSLFPVRFMIVYY